MMNYRGPGGRGTGGPGLRIAALVLAFAVRGPRSAVPALIAQQPAPAAAKPCHIQVDHAERTNFQTAGDGTQNVFSGGGVQAHCIGGSTTIQSDSMTYYQSTTTLQFMGSVKFRDSTGTLDADKVTYWSRIERLFAEGNVYTKNLATGTELRGPNLDFYRVAPGIRDTQELTATNRPIIRFIPASASVTADTLNPFLIVADRVYMKHTDRMWGSGRVIINRRDLLAKADSAALQLGDSVGHLIGTPVVTGYDTTKTGPPVPAFRVDTTRLSRGRMKFDTVRTGGMIEPPDSAVSYRLKGQRIRFDLTHGQKIKRVLSSGDADATGPAWHLTSDTLDMAIDSGQIQRAQAWGEERRAIAVSGLNTITADSLDIQMPGQVMHQVWAYGRSRATSKADSTWIEDDWLSGDSLRATFALRAERRDSMPRRDSLAAPRDATLPPDSATQPAPRRRASQIEQVIAYGTARAYYHTDNQHDPHGERGINYSRGDRINIAMREGKVRTVDIAGKVDGVYLEPVAPRTDSTADSTIIRGDSGIGGRDTTRVPAPTAPSGSVPSPRPAIPPSPRPATPLASRRTP